MTAPKHVAVFDVGKTNAKLALVDLKTQSEKAILTRPNTVRPGPPYPHFDVEGLWNFLLGGLARMQADHGVDAISVTTHGASGALLDDAGELAAPILDYEHNGPDSVAEAYDAIRPPFEETGSPRLPMGLNLGAQLHWMMRQDPGLLARTATVLTYPQYWTRRLTGVASADATSLGCHTDLWRPDEGRPSSLANALGLAERIAPVRRCADILGPILPEIAARSGLRPETPVACGIHDSNASLYAHILGRSPPFSVVSTGTWVVSMSVGGARVALDPTRDTLENVDALGRPAPSARFMGGREHERILDGANIVPTAAEIEALLMSGAAQLPAVEPRSGPFPGRASGWLGEEPSRGSGARAAAAAFYLSLMTAECLELIGHRGEIVVEGAFARNSAYLAMLATATRAPVYAAPSATGTSLGAAMLFSEASPHAAASGTQVSPLCGAERYIEAWRRAVSGS